MFVAFAISEAVKNLFNSVSYSSNVAFWFSSASVVFSFASCAFLNIPVFVNADIDIPAKISKIIMYSKLLMVSLVKNSHPYLLNFD